MPGFNGRHRCVLCVAPAAPWLSSIGSWSCAGRFREICATTARLSSPTIGVSGQAGAISRWSIHAKAFVVDDSAFRNAFGGHTTGWDEIVTSTVDWYRNQDADHTKFNGLAEATTEKVTS